MPAGAGVNPQPTAAEGLVRSGVGSNGSQGGLRFRAPSDCARITSTGEAYSAAVSFIRVTPDAGVSLLVVNPTTYQQV